jgi:hypothetical protein
MRKNYFSLILLLLVILSACKEKVNVQISGMPDAEEVLTLDPNSDIFLWNGHVYKTNIVWVEELKLTKHKELGEITSVSTNLENYNYKNGMANKLPIGAKIFSAKERDDVLLAEYEGKLMKYLGASEG